MLAAAREHDIVAIMANQYAENPHKMSIEHARKMLTEKKTIYKDHLGRPTQAQVLRDKHIISHLQNFMSSTLTPQKARNTFNQLRRSGSSLSLRAQDHGMNTPMMRKKNTRNLMILGSSQSANKTGQNQYFSLQQAPAY